ncbi:hypothetical protein [Niabella ginsengisoli]|uniref:Glucose-6-phosphate isomerase n=1 Tax=Niabella ginsengisoli TaxID=522298 RepID=A0ABS9SJ92_9BACT|nr:hypothetical protein [Niabella ginsengisoli]MCH5598437.1 hypothetical protein [Niabella ginsengisoli]
MFPTINPTKTKAWKQLLKHSEEAKAWNMRQLFSEDNKRAAAFSLQHGDIYFDFSKNLITGNTLQNLLLLAEQTEVKNGIKAMFGGKRSTKPKAGLYCTLL